MNHPYLWKIKYSWVILPMSRLEMFSKNPLSDKEYLLHLQMADKQNATPTNKSNQTELFVLYMSASYHASVRHAPGNTSNF